MLINYVCLNYNCNDNRMLKMLPAAMYMKYKTNDKRQKKYTNKIK